MGDAAEVHQPARAGWEPVPVMVSLDVRAARPQCAVRGDKPSVGASAHQRARKGLRQSAIPPLARFTQLAHPARITVYWQQSSRLWIGI